MIIIYHFTHPKITKHYHRKRSQSTTITTYNQLVFGDSCLKVFHASNLNDSSDSPKSCMISQKLNLFYSKKTNSLTLGI